MNLHQIGLRRSCYHKRITWMERQNVKFGENLEADNSPFRSDLEDITSCDGYLLRTTSSYSKGKPQKNKHGQGNKNNERIAVRTAPIAMKVQRENVNLRYEDLEIMINRRKFKGKRKKKCESACSISVNIFKNVERNDEIFTRYFCINQ